MMTNRKTFERFLGALAILSLGVSLQTVSGAQPGRERPLVPVTPVLLRELSRQIRLPGELSPCQEVAVFPKVQGFVEAIPVDRGSVVRRGDLLVKTVAPELVARRSEAQARVRAAEAQRAEGISRLRNIQAQKTEAETRFASSEATYKRLKAASATPGAVSGEELDVAQKSMEAEQARAQGWSESEQAARSEMLSLEENEKAATEAARSAQDIESYLRVTAPFDGIITERMVHTGSLVGSSAGPSGQPMLRIQQINPLRLTVAVPEAAVAGIVQGTKLRFTVPAFPGEYFEGVIQRIAHSLDVKTRTMPVELDVANPSGRLASGMFAEVEWLQRRPRPSLFVPPTSVVSTTERSFVIRIVNGVVEWVDVKRGVPMGGLVEVFGDLKPGDLVAIRATDELRAGTPVIAKTQ